MKATIRLNGKEKEIEITEEQVEAFGFEFPKVWKPVNGDTYWFIDNSGRICSGIRDDDDTVYKYRWKTSNCYQTKAECEFEREQAKVEAALKNFAKEHNEPIEWGKCDQFRFFIGWNFYNAQICIKSRDGYLKDKNIYFSSEEIAEAAVRAVGADRVKKYYLEVE